MLGTGLNFNIPLKLTDSIDNNPIAKSPFVDGFNFPGNLVTINFIITETGDFIITQGGDFVIQE